MQKTGYSFCYALFFIVNDSNFDRNPLRGCNYGLEGVHFDFKWGATTALGGATIAD